MSRFAKKMRPYNLKQTQENTVKLAELLKDVNKTNEFASDNLIEAMAEITTFWRKKLEGEDI